MMDSDYYLQYVEAVDECGKDVSDWEATFIESMLKNRPARLSLKQVEIIRVLADKYLGEQVR